MKTRLTLTIFLILLMASSSYALTGREIIEKTEALPSPDSTYSEVHMVIHSGGSAIEKEFQSEGVKVDDNSAMTLITFTKPSKSQFLTHNYKNKSDDQWLKMTSGKVKRITNASKKKSFAGSDFTYEDLSTRNIDDYEYKLLGTEDVAGTECYKVESTRIKGKKVYSKTILYPRKSDCFIKRIDFYEKDRFSKYLVNYKIKEIDGILTPEKIVMSRTQKKAKTVLKIKKLAYNIEISKAKFNKDAFR